MLSMLALAHRDRACRQLPMACSSSQSQLASFPTHLAHLNAAVASKLGNGRDLARMAMVCREWWRAARAAVGYMISGHELMLMMANSSTDYAVHVTSVDRCPTGSRLLVGSAQGSLCLWDLHDNGSLRVVENMSEHGTSVRSLADLSEHGLVASGSDNCSIKLWDMNSGQVRRELVAHRSDVMALAPMPGTNFLASGSLGGRLFLWDVTTGSVKRLNVYEHSVLTMAGLPNGWLAVASVDYQSEVSCIDLWDCNARVPIGRCVWPPSRTRRRDGVSEDPLKTIVAIVVQDETISNTAHGSNKCRVVAAMGDGTVGAWCINFGPRDTNTTRASTLVHVTPTQPELVFHLPSKIGLELLPDVDGYEELLAAGSMVACASSPCVAGAYDDRVAISCSDKAIRVYSTSTGRLHLVLPYCFHGGASFAQLFSIAALPCGKLVAIGSVPTHTSSEDEDWEDRFCSADIGDSNSDTDSYEHGRYFSMCVWRIAEEFASKS